MKVLGRPDSGIRDLHLRFSQMNASRARVLLSGGIHPGH